MATTANRGYHYPALTDTPNGPAQIQQLANDVDADVQALYADTGTVTASGILTPTSTGSIRTVAPTSGWFRKIGKEVKCHVTFTCSTSTSLVIPASGDVANTLVYTLTDARFIPVANAIAMSAGTSGPLSVWSLATDGTISLTSISPGVTSPLASGQVLSFYGAYTL